MKIAADIDQLLSLGKTFSSEADQIGALMRTIGTQVHSAWWMGPAHDAFVAEWDGQYVKSLTSLENALRSAGTDVQNRAERIRVAGTQ